jgi:hypothetical protein
MNAGRRGDCSANLRRGHGGNLTAIGIRQCWATSVVT